MSQSIRLLLVEDSEDDVLLLIRALERYGYEVAWRRVDTADELSEALGRQHWDVVLVDYTLSGFSGTDALEAILSGPQRPGIVMVSGTISEETAVRTLKTGAHDYVLKDNLTRLGPAVDHALREARNEAHQLQVNQELRRSEEKYRRLYESMRDSFVHLDMGGRIVDSNTAYQDMLGYETEELIMIDYLTLVPQRWHAIEREIFATQVLKRGFSEIYEEEFRKKDGTIIPVEVRRVLLRDDAGEPCGTWSTVREITERKVHENRLERERTLLVTLINNLPDLIYLKDLESRFVLGNRALMDSTGVADAAGIVGKTDHDLFPREMADGFRADERRVMETGERQVNKEEPVTLVDGSQRWVLTTKVPIFDERGAVSGVVGIGRDITDRKQRERQARELSAAIHNAPDLIVLTDAAGRITYVNPAFETVCGYTREEALGKNPRLLKSGVHDGAFYGGLWETITAGKVWRGQIVNCRKDGSRYHEHKTIAPITDETGAITGFVGIGRDVTQEVALETQLRRVQRLESLGTLASGIAHDLNNILAPILMGAESLRARHRDEYTLRILGIIGASAQRGADIVRQVLTFARGVEGHLVEVQLRHVLREVEGIMRETFPKSIDLQIDFVKDLWPVTGDSTQVHQVLMNVCLNARDAMPDGGTLSLSARNIRLDEAYAKLHLEARPIPYALLQVDDTGAGMRAEVMERVFDPFFTTKAPGKGTGLGLATTLSIVKAHHGFINVYSEPGKGSSFKIYFPAHPQEAPVAGAVAEPELPTGVGELILVVDDEAAVREITRETLESYGYRVVVAADGAEALLRYAEYKDQIRVIVTDMMMPHMDGAALISAVRKIDPDAKVIATSGLAANGESGGLRVDAVLPKPYGAAALLKTLRDALAS